METLSLLSRNVHIHLLNEKASLPSFLEILWGAAHIWGLAYTSAPRHGQYEQSPFIYYALWVGITTSQLTARDAFRSGTGDGKLAASGSSVSLHAFWFQAGNVPRCVWPGQTQEVLSLLKLKNKPKLFGTSQTLTLCLRGKARIRFWFDMSTIPQENTNSAG